MSLYDTSGSAFYSESTYPNAGSQAPDQHSIAQDTESFANDAGEIPQTAKPPVYTRYNEAGEDTFAPLPQPSDPTFQPANANPPVQTGFQFQPWMLLAAGAALVLWMRSEK